MAAITPSPFNMGHVLWIAILCAFAMVAMLGAADAAYAPAMTRPLSYEQMAKVNVTVDLSQDSGPLELWRLSIGAGGISPHPLPGGVVDGLAKLHPRLIRVFIQEFFDIYPEHGRYDWTRLDPYMDALEKTGAKVVAAITIKPRPLYPTIDPAIWRPNDVKEWQQVIAALVKRYSVDRKLVTYWEIGNETDIGENGGCPYLIPDAKDYAEYYKMTLDPILATFPQAKVGGPGVADVDGKLLPGFINICHRDGLRLDFISWHLYNDDPAKHASHVEKLNKLLDVFGDKRPETFVTEWNKGFDKVSLEELAYDPRRAASAAACALAMNDAKVSGSFYYHAWDQIASTDDFARFFKDPQIMYVHWNEFPHRFGLFGVDEEVRPQYFVFQMFSRMLDRRVAAESDAKDVRVLASRSDNACAILLVNYGMPHSDDHVVTLHLAGLTPGHRKLTVYRIDGRKGWSAEKMELEPVEQRRVEVQEKFSFSTYSPADSVSLAILAPIAP